MRTKFTLIAGAAVLVGVAVACDDTSSTPTDYAPLLRSLTENVMLPAHATFATTSDTLDAAMHDLETTPTSDTLSKAQTAWRAARGSFRRLDALHFGPIADPLAISERIDLAPANASDVDAIVALTTPLDASTVGNAGGHAKGFLGIEHLIFSSKGEAAALVLLQGDGAASRRRTLARLMADEIASSAHQLNDAWIPGRGAYATEIETAGTTSKRYPSQRAVLDDLVGGVGYALELVVGVRLALPLGHKAGGTPDPSQDPTAASDSTAADIEASLDGVHALYDGNGLSSRVQPKSTVLDSRLETQLGDCATKVAAIPAPFDSAFPGGVPMVQAAFDACKSAKGTWNTDVTSALGATPRPTDNDGD